LLDNPTGGQLYFFDYEVSNYSERKRTILRKENIGFVFQSFNLIDELSVYENVELPLLYLKMPALERKQKVEQVLERMQIAHRRRHFPQQLSGGQQQRVAVARALSTSPKMILADEPTANLDTANGHQVMDIMKKLNKETGVTFIFATHDPRVISYADRVVTLEDGLVVKDTQK